MRPFRLIAAIVILLIVGIGVAALFKERIAETLARKYLGVEKISIAQISVGGDLSFTINGLDVTFDGQRVEFASIYVAPLDAGQIAGRKSARVRGEQVRLHFRPKFGGKKFADAGALALPIPPNFAMPHLQLRDVRGAFEWDGRVFDFILAKYTMTPAKELSRANFTAEIDLENVAKVNLRGEVSASRLSVNVLPMSVSFEALAKAAGIGGIKGGDGLLELRIEQSSRGLSVTGRAAVQALTLPGPDGGIAIAAAKAEFGTPDPSKGIRARGSAIVRGLPKINFRGGVSPKGIDLTFDIPKVNPKRIIFLAAIKSRLAGVGKIKGKVVGPLQSPKISWQFASNNLTYSDPGNFRKPLSVGAAAGDLEVGVNGLRRASITAEVENVPFSLKIHSDAAGKKQQVRVALTKATPVIAFRNLLPSRRMGAISRDVLRQMRQGIVKKFDAEVGCAATMSDCLEDANLWKIHQGRAIFSDLNISPVPRAPSFQVQQATLTLKPNGTRLEVATTATKVRSGQLSKGFVVTVGSPLKPPRSISGELHGAMTLAEIVQIVGAQAPGLASLGLSVKNGLATGKITFVADTKAVFSKLAARAKLTGGAGTLGALGNFDNLEAEIAGNLGPNGVIPLVISSMSVAGADWQVSANGTANIAGVTVFPNLTIKARVSPGIVNRFLADTGGFTWSGGAVRAQVQLTGDSNKALAATGTFDGGAACIRRGETIIKDCKEALKGNGRIDFQMATKDAAMKLSGLQLAGRPLLKSASARRRDGQWIVAMRSAKISWPWLAKRARLTLPKGAGGNVRFNAQLSGKDAFVRLKAANAAIPKGFGAAGELSGAVNLRDGIIDVAGEVSLTAPRVVKGKISGTVKDIFGSSPETLLKISAPDVDIRSNWHEKVAKEEGKFNIKAVNDWLKGLPFPELLGSGRVSFSFPNLKVGQAKGDLLDGAGNFSWTPLNQRLDLKIARKKAAIGLFRITGSREDLLQPMAMVGAFAVQNLPMTLIGSWLGQPDLFSQGLGAARGRIRTRWGWELPLWQGKFEISAKNVQLGKSKLAADLLTQAGMPDEARTLTDDGAGIVAKEIRFLGRFRREHLEINPLFLNSTAFDVFAQGKVALSDGGLKGNIAFKPLQDAAGAISKIPLLGYLVTGKSGSLVEFTWKLDGTLDSPALSKSPEVDTSKGILGAMRRFNELPGLLFSLRDED